jgi:hypothetical protein
MPEWKVNRVSGGEYTGWGEENNSILNWSNFVNFNQIFHPRKSSKTLEKGYWPLQAFHNYMEDEDISMICLTGSNNIIMSHRGKNLPADPENFDLKNPNHSRGGFKGESKVEIRFKNQECADRFLEALSKSEIKLQPEEKRPPPDSPKITPPLPAPGESPRAKIQVAKTFSGKAEDLIKLLDFVDSRIAFSPEMKGAIADWFSEELNDLKWQKENLAKWEHRAAKP